MSCWFSGKSRGCLVKHSICCVGQLLFFFICMLVYSQGNIDSRILLFRLQASAFLESPLDELRRKCHNLLMYRLASFTAGPAVLK
ncbi:hypothetical protein B6259_04850 [Ruminococcaceae bacterium CPB6]|nr:hypothetical protein B6259_04850 [Ruminococcaceae bacterium CPB6]